MTIDQMIEQLQQLKQQYGDVKIVVRYLDHNRNWRAKSFEQDDVKFHQTTNFSRPYDFSGHIAIVLDCEK